MRRWKRRFGLALASAVPAILLSTPAAAALPGQPVRAAVAEPGNVSVYLYTERSAIRPGETVDYVMSVSGQPPTAPAADLKAVLELPQWVTFDSGPCQPDAAGSVVTCTPDAGSGGTHWRVTARVAADAPVGRYLTATARVSTTSPDGDPSDNESSARILVATDIDMSVTISGPTRPVTPGSTFEFTVTIRNAGPIRSPFDMRLVFSVADQSVSGLPRDLCGQDPAEATCSFRDLKPGEPYVIPLRMLARPSYQGRPLEITAEIYPYAPDTNRANDKATLVVQVARSTPSPAPPGGGGGQGDGPILPITGLPVGTVALAGLALIAAGAGAVLVARRRRWSPS